MLFLRQQRDLAGIIAVLQPMPAPLTDNAEAWLRLGEALFWSHRLDAAVTAFERCVLLDDTVHLAHNNLAWILATERGHPDDALRHAQRALALAGQVADYHDTYLEVVW